MDIWEKWYTQAKKYYLANGNLEVSSNYIDEDGMALGRWIHRQRSKYRGTDSHGTALTQNEISKLETIGMIWDPLENTWNKNFKSACIYFNSFGDLLVPAKYIDKNNLKLGRWISTQRRLYADVEKRKTIPVERINKLNSIGMVWDPFLAQWEENFKAAKLFYDENGHLYIPKNYYTCDGINLGAWIPESKK